MSLSLKLSVDARCSGNLFQSDMVLFKKLVFEAIFTAM